MLNPTPRGLNGIVPACIPYCRHCKSRPVNGLPTRRQTIVQTEFAIVGAGPAGMAAALTAAKLGVDVTIIDEQRTPGGQVYRQPPPEFDVADWLSSKAYRPGKALLAQAGSAPKIRWLMAGSVTGVFKPDTEGGPYTLVVSRPDGVIDVQAGGVLLAPGCFDMPVAFPGWNLPGVMSAGGIQVFMKSQQYIPGQEICFVGSHPLQLIVADQVLEAGGQVKEVLFLQRQSDAARLFWSPNIVLRHFGKLRQAGSALLRLRRAGVKVRFGQTIVRAEGQEQLEKIIVGAVNQAGLLQSGGQREIQCDRVGVCFGFIAASELARQAGADGQWRPTRGGWIATHDPWMQSSLRGMFVAGEITGIGGAEVAEEEGRLAALGWALHSGRLTDTEAHRKAVSTRSRLRALQQFADFLSETSAPDDPFFEQLLDDQVTLCKCEEVTVGEVRAALADHTHLHSANAAKLFTRAGMGLCQGRYCEHAVRRLLGKLSPLGFGAGGFNARFPAKPARIDHLVRGVKKRPAD